jgi:hypothetical protein
MKVPCCNTKSKCGEIAFVAIIFEKQMITGELRFSW